MAKRVKVSFWARNRTRRWKDKDSKKIYNKLLKLNNELDKLLDELSKKFTK